MIPVYNEAPRIKVLLKRWVQIVDLLSRPARFVIVNDGSSDGSAGILDEFKRGREGVTVIHHEINQGLGTTLRDGLRYVADHAKAEDILVVMDGDNTQPPEVLPEMLSKMEKTACDVVIASRYRGGSGVEGLSLFRRMMSLGARAVFQLAFPIKNVLDYTCGYRLYKVSAIKRAFDVYGVKFCSRPGFDCCVDILLRLAKLGYSFQEVPFQLSYGEKNGNSHMCVVRTATNTIGLLLSRRFCLTR